MKKTFLILFLFPFLSYAQIGSKKIALSEGTQDSVLGTSFVLKENSILFQKVYATTLENKDLVEKLEQFLPSVKNFQLTDSPNQKTSQYSGRINGFVVNYRKYGGTLMGTPGILNYPISANIIIQVKDSKYRVTVSDIVFKGVKVLLEDHGTDVVFDDVISKNKRQKIRTADNVLNIAGYMDKDISDSFDITKVKKINSEF